MARPDDRRGVPGILLVEDDSALRELLAEELSDAGYPVVAVASAEEALQRPESFEAVITDLRLPGLDGLALVDALLARADTPPVLVITAFGTIRQAVEALRRGATDFLTKPIDLEHLRIAVGRALEQGRLRRELRRARALLEEDGYHGILGHSPPVQRLCAQITQVARANGPVLILGESGTGKELVARAIHAEAGGHGPFVAVNCAGIPEALLESEFFGHAPGAYTGADSRREGLFVEADGGVLLLDEIGEMPPALQAKLLRVLETGRVRPLGGDGERKVQVRVLAATHLDLQAGVADGRFRADLYYRLEAFQLQVPPLRDRGDDLEMLAARFLHRFAIELDRPVQRLSVRALARMRAYPWPGNVRELRNAMERAVAFAAGEVVEEADLPDRIRRNASPVPRPEAGTASPFPEPPVPLAELERRYIQHVLARLDGNKRRAAEVLGIGRRTLYRKLEPGGDA